MQCSQEACSVCVRSPVWANGVLQPSRTVSNAFTVRRVDVCRATVNALLTVVDLETGCNDIILQSSISMDCKQYACSRSSALATVSVRIHNPTYLTECMCACYSRADIVAIVTLNAYSRAISATVSYLVTNLFKRAAFVSGDAYKPRSLGL